MSCLLLLVFLTFTALVQGGRNDTSSEKKSSQEQNSEDQRTPGAECDRKCGGPTLNCYFHFILERYTALSGACGNCTNGVRKDCFKPQCIPADGYPRPILTINRSLPGPPIVVCQNDTVIVDVDNRMDDLSTTIHWHGIRQFGTPYMDGVPMVTQCPILPYTTFRYRFLASEAGTFFYHSHIGPQKLDGLEGALIVRGVRSKERHRDLYDKDLTKHVIAVQDWLHTTSYYWVPGQHIPGSNQIPSSVLINGIGPLWRNGSNDFVPMARFRVQQGLRYRFRLIGATCMTCLYALTIQGHRLTVITTDGGLYIEPTVVDSISVNSADRFDFVLTANNTVGSYYIFVENVNPFCGEPGELRQIGVLEYKGSNTSLSMPPPIVEDFGVILNPPDSPCNGSRPDQICVSDLSGEFNAPAVAGNNATYQLIPVDFGVYLYTPEELFNSFQIYEEPVFNAYARFTVNNITFGLPPSPLLTQYKDIPKENFCKPECYEGGIEKSCICTNYYPIALNTIVDLIVTDKYDTIFNHPFHLHGTNFFVRHMGMFPSLDPVVVENTIQELKANASQDRYSLVKQPQKDTITIPAGGYAVLRFIANNPGWWLLHCHFVYHLEVGMAAVFKIGENMPPAPPNFPKCGNFLD